MQSTDYVYDEIVYRSNVFPITSKLGSIRLIRAEKDTVFKYAKPHRLYCLTGSLLVIEDAKSKAVSAGQYIESRKPHEVRANDLMHMLSIQSESIDTLDAVIESIPMAQFQGIEGVKVFPIDTKNKDPAAAIVKLEKDFEEHVHEGDETITCLLGNVCIYTGKKKQSLNLGERVDIEKKTKIYIEVLKGKGKGKDSSMNTPASYIFAVLTKM